jgi:hypothetical protein
MLQYWRVYAMLLVLLGFGVTKFYGIFSNAGYAPIQPIPFSHAMHAGVLKLECLYCHSNAEKGAHATIPPLSTCMGCHNVVKVNNSPYIKMLEEHYAANKPIEWVRIHRLLRPLRVQPSVARRGWASHARPATAPCRR